eukprot:Lithocolla_globosa_v1_NODE_695_length_3420_cov_22.731055.p2 type:complete len:423 gc:universal NODE_695_length_3420_cov_22.731055:2030-3298(+)
MTDLSITNEALEQLWCSWKLSLPNVGLLGVMVRQNNNDHYACPKGNCGIGAPADVFDYLLPPFMMSSSFLPVYWSEKYQFARQYVDTQSAHCDDLFANKLVQSLGKEVVQVPLPHGVKQEDATNGLGLMKNRLEMRTQCMIWLENNFADILKEVVKLTPVGRNPQQCIPRKHDEIAIAAPCDPTVSSNEYSVRDYTRVSAANFLKDFESAIKTLKPPPFIPRNPKNPQRMILEGFLNEVVQSGKLLPGRCLEFDEDNYMTTFSTLCPQKDILIYDKHLQKEQKGITTITHGDLLKVDAYEPNLIDTVFFTEVLEHLTNPLEGAKALYRIVKPCGYVLLTTPFIYMIHADPHDYFRFTADGVKTVMQNAGFKTLSCELRGTLMTVIAASMGLNGEDIPNFKDHIEAKKNKIGSVVVGLFQKTC